MKVLVRKMSSLGILKLQMVVGAIVMIASIIVLPAGIISMDASLLLNPFVLGVVLVGMLMFGSFAYFLFIRPYFVYRSLPEVLVETDGEYLYIYGKKQAKIPLSDFEDVLVHVSFPFIYSKEIVAVLLVHLFSEKYGDISLDIPGYGSYELPFVSEVQKTADELIAYIREAK